MDSGYIPPGDTFEDEVDFSQPLKAKHALWIMDQLMCLEIAWLDGYPLSQTVFTSLHIDRLLNSKYHDQSPAAFKSKILSQEYQSELGLVRRALLIYCIGAVQCCHLALKLIQSQNFYEEEDLVTHLFGRELLPEITAEEANDELQWMRTEYGEQDFREDVHGAILQRLDFRQDYLRLLSGQNVDEAIPEFSVYWPDLLRQVDNIRHNHKFSTPYPSAFSDKVQRQLATSTPPRPMLDMPWDTACDKWKTLCEDFIAAQRLTSSEIIHDPASLHKAVWAFSYRGQPGCLARADIQSILFGQQAVKGEAPHYELLLADIRDLVLAGDDLTKPQSFEVELPSDPRHLCSRHMESFMDKAIEEFLNLYRMVCQNRCRIRRTFTQAIPILDELETVAIATDKELATLTSSLRMKMNGHIELLQPLSDWTKFHKLRIMAWTVQLGFETEICLLDELGTMYWFLAHLSEQRAQLIEHIMAFTTERMRQMKDKSIKRECNASIEYLRSLLNTALITMAIAEVLSIQYGLLMDLNIITAPKRDFAQMNLLYEARMKPFLGQFNYSPPDSDEFNKRRQQANTPKKVAADIDQKLKRAKNLIAQTKKMTPQQAKYIGTEDEWKKEWKQLETTCVAISVGVSQLLRACEKYGEADISKVMECKAEKKYHEWWVIPQLKEKMR